MYKVSKYSEGQRIRVGNVCMYSYMYVHVQNVTLPYKRKANPFLYVSTLLTTFVCTCTVLYVNMYNTRHGLDA